MCSFNKLTLGFHTKFFHLSFYVSLSHLLAGSRWCNLVRNAEEIFIVIVINIVAVPSSPFGIAAEQMGCLSFLAVYRVMDSEKLIRRLIIRWTGNVLWWWIWNGNFDFFMFASSKAWKAFRWSTSQARRSAVGASIAVRRLMIIWPATAVYPQCQPLFLKSITDSFRTCEHDFCVFV